MSVTVFKAAAWDLRFCIWEANKSNACSGNRFNDISIPASLTCENGSAFQAVATLNLDFTLLSWSDVRD